MAEHSDYMRGYFDGELTAYERVLRMLNDGLPYYALNGVVTELIQTIKESRFPEEEK